MSGISCSEYGEVEQAAVNEAMWVILTGLKSISQHTCTDVAGTRRRQLLTDAVNIGLEVTVRDAAFNVSDKAEIAHSVQDDLAVSAASGDFSTLIADAAAALDSSSPLLTVLISETLAPTSAPTSAPSFAPSFAPTADGDDDTGQAMMLIWVVIAIAVLVIVIVIACAAFILGRAAARVNHSAAIQVVPVSSTQVAQTPACVELVPIGVVKTSVLVTQQDNNGNTIVHEQAVAADRAVVQTTLPQGTILRRSSV